MKTTTFNAADYLGELEAENERLRAAMNAAVLAARTAIDDNTLIGAEGVAFNKGVVAAMRAIERGLNEQSVTVDLYCCPHCGGRLKEHKPGCRTQSNQF
jgi:hypothetical protein